MVFKKTNNDTCLICLDIIKVNKYKLNCDCNAIYHKECIFKWFLKERKCPICKRIVHINYHNKQLEILFLFLALIFSYFYIIILNK